MRCIGSIQIFFLGSARTTSVTVWRTVVITLGMLGASTWVGSLVCLAVVSAAATKTLDGQSRVALFRRVGRLYGVVGTTSLLTAIMAGLALAWPPSDIDGALALMFVLAGVLVVATAAGMAQARRMTVIRHALLAAPTDARTAARVRRGALVATLLRGSLAAITLAILVIGARLLDR